MSLTNKLDAKASSRAGERAEISKEIIAALAESGYELASEPQYAVLTSGAVSGLVGIPKRRDGIVIIEDGDKVTLASCWVSGRSSVSVNHATEGAEEVVVAFVQAKA